jgi:ATP-binding cassette, subfamily B, bacterial
VLAASTALVVAHRPSTVLLADRVALLDGGVIAAVSTHQELLATRARYRELMTGTARPGPDEDLGLDPHPDQDLTEARR